MTCGAAIESVELKPEPPPQEVAVAEPAPSPTPPPEPPGPPPAHLIDAIVYAAADAADVIPRAMRPALRAAFARARELGVSVDAFLAGLGEAK